MNEVVSQILLNIALSSPNYVVFLAGFLACCQRWNRHPRVSFALFCGLAALTAASLLANVGIPLGYHIATLRGAPAEEAATITMFVRAAAAIPYGIGFSLMLYAALAGRSTSPLNSKAEGMGFEPT